MAAWRVWSVSKCVCWLHGVVELPPVDSSSPGVFGES